MITNIHIQHATIHLEQGENLLTAVAQQGPAQPPAPQPQTYDPQPLAPGSYYAHLGGVFLADLASRPVARPGVPAAYQLGHLVVAQEARGRSVFGLQNLQSDSDLIDGASNTAVLLNADSPHPAAQAAADYGYSLDQGERFGDFFLPSLSELLIAYRIVPDLFDDDAVYWTSSSLCESKVWALGGDGLLHTLDKDLTATVLPFRSQRF